MTQKCATERDVPGNMGKGMRNQLKSVRVSGRIRVNNFFPRQGVQSLTGFDGTASPTKFVQW